MRIVWNRKYTQSFVNLLFNHFAKEAYNIICGGLDGSLYLLHHYQGLSGSEFSPAKNKLEDIDVLEIDIA